MTASPTSSDTATEVDVALAPLTSLRLGGRADRVVTATTESELIDAVALADERHEPVLLLGGGTNVVIADAGFRGTVVRPLVRGTRPESADSCGGVVVTVGAGEPWEDLVDRAVASGWAGLETLTGIPGLTGATPVQNVGAYGADVSSVIAQVRTYDRERRRVTTFAAADCGFGYRSSRFRHDPRWVVLAVQFQLPLAGLSAPIAYAELARSLGVAPGSRVPLAEVRDAVRELRRGKGMLLDPDDHDAWSVGSFFVNPRLPAASAAALPAPAPRWPDGDLVKTSAAWLIEQAGFPRGYGSGRVGISHRHTLALTHRGGGTTRELLDLAREVRAGVLARFGILLEAEPVLVGEAL